MTTSLPVRVRAPATTANLGPGFDCAGAALDLWNELEVSEGEGVEVHGEGAGAVPLSSAHLGLRAFALIAPVDGLRFVFTNGIPFTRGLGSSSSTIALGLVAASVVSGRPQRLETLLELGLELESHADNLAPALAGGVCLTWQSAVGKQRVARIAPSLPLAAIAVVPEEQVETASAREALPAEVSHLDASLTVSRAALLGAGLASGACELLAEAFAGDRLHEPYRGPLSPVFGPIHDELPTGAVGATISGSGPTVIVWAREHEAVRCADELEGRFPTSQVLRLVVVPSGAGPFEPAAGS
ncbi:MAG: homoserine kinase [Gaiellales bacterium]